MAQPRTKVIPETNKLEVAIIAAALEISLQGTAMGPTDQHYKQYKERFINTYNEIHDAINKKGNIM